MTEPRTGTDTEDLDVELSQDWLRKKGVDLDLDPRTARRNREAREMRYHTVGVPCLRILGFGLLAGLVILHERVRPGAIDWRQVGWFLGGTGIYAIASWLVLRFVTKYVKPTTAGLVFLSTDLVVLTAAVYVTGGEKSWLFFLPILRVADQMYAGFKRSILFTMLGVLCSVGLLDYLAFVEQRAIDWRLEGWKVLTVTMLSVYISITALSVLQVHQRTKAAIHLSRELIRRLKRKSKELSESTRDAEEASRTKGMFLANMSHEIRTPMNGIIGMTDLALKTKLTDEQRDYLTTVQGSAESLLRIINDVLDFSKIEAGKFDIQEAPFSLRESIGKTLRALALQAQEKGVELVCNVDPAVPDRIVGDEFRLSQVITNLVGNAIKFTSQGEVMLEVEIATLRQESGALRFSVSDTGIGISAELQQQIFHAFTQADGSNNRQFGGTGLGLAISYQLVEMMGGRLRVASEEGRGSTFWFHVPFPLADEGEQGSEQGPQADLPLADQRVLVLVPNSNSAFACARMLEHLGAEVRLARDAVVGAAILRQLRDQGEAVQLLLMDISCIDDGETLQVERMLRLVDMKTTVAALCLPTQKLGELLGATQNRVHKVLHKPLIGPELVTRLLNSSAKAPNARKPKRRVLTTEAPRRLLLVEDNVVNQKLACILLGSWGHEVEIASNGVEAVEMSGRLEYDVILMDVQMPRMDGYEATRAIREREAEAGIHTPIVAMTANAMEGDRERCLESGMDSYVSKPINAEELFSIIEGAGQYRRSA